MAKLNALTQGETRLVPGPFPTLVERAATVSFLVLGALWMGILGFIWVNNPELHHGDSYSDANVLNAARNFDRAGFRRLRGLLYHDATWTPERPGTPYTHYPPGPEWVHEALKTLGLRDLSAFRLASIVVSSIALLLFFHVASKLTESRTVAALASFFYACSPAFASLADSLHMHAYAQLTLFVCLAAWLAYELASAPMARRTWLTLAAFAYFCDLWMTFEHIVMIPLFAAGRLLLNKGRATRSGLLAILGAGSLALCTRVVHNSVGLGGLGPALRDLGGVATYRAGLSDTLRHQNFLRSAATLVEVWSMRLGWTAVEPVHHDAQLAYPVLARAPLLLAGALGIVVLCMRAGRSAIPVRRGIANGLLLLLVGGAWFLAMSNHSKSHRHIVMLLTPGFALVLGAFAGAGLQQIWSARRGAPIRWVGPLLTSALVFAFAWPMRGSIALNQIASLDQKVRALVERRREATRVLARAGNGPLRQVERLHVSGEKYPELVYHLGLPYEFVRPATKVPTISPSSVCWVEYWSDAEKALAWQAMERWGFPDVLSEPYDLSLVFWGRGTTSYDTDVRWENGVRLLGLRSARSLDGASVVIQALLDVPEDLLSELNLLVHFVHALDTAQEVIYKSDLNFEWTPRREGRILAIHRLPAAKLPEPLKFRVGLWSSKLMRNLKAVNESPRLPPGATWNADRSWYVWEPGSP